MRPGVQLELGVAVVGRCPQWGLILRRLGQTAPAMTASRCTLRPAPGENHIDARLIDVCLISLSTRVIRSGCTQTHYESWR